MPYHPQRGGVVGSLLLILGILVLATVVTIVAGGIYLARNVHVTASKTQQGKDVTVETPFGSLNVREDARLDPKRLGVPLYPGAVLAQDHHKLAKVELNFGNDGQGLAIVAGEYTTPDSIDKVREFYRAELPHWMVSEGRHGDVHFSFTEGGYKRMVVLKERGGLTCIALVSIGAPAAN